MERYRTSCWTACAAAPLLERVQSSKFKVPSGPPVLRGKAVHESRPASFDVRRSWGALRRQSGGAPEHRPDSRTLTRPPSRRGYRQTRWTAPCCAAFQTPTVPDRPLESPLRQPALRRATTAGPHKIVEIQLSCKRMTVCPPVITALHSRSDNRINVIRP
jgi:hypothetical protein